MKKPRKLYVYLLTATEPENYSLILNQVYSTMAKAQARGPKGANWKNARGLKYAFFAYDEDGCYWEAKRKRVM